VTFDPLGELAPRGRRAARRAEQQRRRQRRGRAIGGALAVVVLFVGGFVLFASTGGSDDGPTGPVRTQRTLLFQVTGGDGTAVASALLAHDPKAAEGAVVLIPPQVIVAVPGAGSQLFGKAIATAGLDGSRNGLGDLLGVTVDGTWVIDSAAFVRLVDGAGGIGVDVDVPVLSGRTVVLSPGQQRVDGQRALAFATYLVAGEQEQSRLARLQSVLAGILKALPADPAPLVGSLGAGSRQTQPIGEVASLLAGLAKDAGADALQYRSLPVVRIEAGTDATRFRIDTNAARVLADELLADSVPPGVREEGNRVLVLNGVGTPGLGATVRDKLVRNGLVFVGSRNAPTFGYATTLVLVKEATIKDAELGARVAKAIGVPSSAVQVSDQIGTVADVVVIVGKDFKP
jgi:hypothetical protein